MKWKAVCLLMLFCLSLQAQEVLFTAHWTNHEYQSYVLEHQEYTRIGDDTLSLESFSFVCDILIEDSLPKHYSLSWRMHGFSLQTDHYLSRQWFQSLDDFRLDYVVSHLGVLEHLLNADAFDLALNKSVDDFFASYAGETVLADRERLYALRDDFERFILSAVQQYHQAYGLAYSIGEVLDIPTEVEWASSRQPAHVFKKLEAVDAETATLVTATVLDSLPGQENTGAWVNHLPSGWVLFSYDSRELIDKQEIPSEDTPSGEPKEHHPALIRGEYSEIRLRE